MMNDFVWVYVWKMWQKQKKEAILKIQKLYQIKTNYIYNIKFCQAKSTLNILIIE